VSCRVRRVATGARGERGEPAGAARRVRSDRRAGARFLLQSGAPLSAEHWRLVDAMVAIAVSSRWSEPDHGIWEIRGPRRHHVHSKVMCWQAAALGVEIAEQHLGRQRPDWVELRDAIAADILANGFERRGGLVHGGVRGACDRCVGAGGGPLGARGSDRRSLRRDDRRGERVAACRGTRSSGTGWTTGCPGPRAGSTSARRG
jgi:hypothetical protein